MMQEPADRMITVTLDGQQHTVERGTAIGDVLLPHIAEHKTSILAARVNNLYCSLNEPLTSGSLIEPVNLTSIEGTRIYRKTLIFLFELAVRRTLPRDNHLVIGYHLRHGFYYRHVRQNESSDRTAAGAIEAAMRCLIDDDLPIVPHELSWPDALTYFEQQGMDSTAALIEERNEARIRLWHCNGMLSFRHHPLAPRTGIASMFAVEPYRDGYLLRYPLAATPQSLGPREDESKLYDIYREHRQWGEILGVTRIPHLNALSIDRRKAREYIHTAEALHDRKIAEITGQITARRNEVKIILIAGPSSSGKTTFTKKLALSMKSAGLRPQSISLDDYYLDRRHIPYDDEGKPDFEALEALDLAHLASNLEDLLQGRETEIPIFDFKRTGMRTPQGRKMVLDDNGLVIFEGIHGLNPHLIDSIHPKTTFSIYVSVLSGLNPDNYTRIPTTDSRLIRRIVRDHQFRHYSALDTLRIWPSVRRGEKKHIFPYQNSSDIMFNSALDYEPAVLKVFAEPLLRTVSPREPEYGEAKRLMSLLHMFSSFPIEEVPEFSIIREFMGRSGFEY